MVAKRFRVSSDEAEVDMTPMLDIVFIMLIFFIVTATFVNERGLDVTRPDSDEPPPNQKTMTILISIAESGIISIDGRDIDVRAVRANVERLIAENPDSSVVVQADPKSRSNLLVGVMDQARLAGAAGVSIAELQ
ncbi:MAG: biopolymer transporter ExbD [Rhodospirillaceae bacterium]|nr:biopolymer transporter ExbD [Rhodospirillaceae bacterium]